ncbi:Hypothetical protein POVR2_LOCUS318 [uncultured virus]|nr:Hypothetical protein POVR2_LOCUS318 [uncultured virus]
MYRGPGPVVSTRTYKSREVAKPAVRVRESKLHIATTQPLAGHPVIQFKRGVSAADIYPLTKFTYEEQERMEVRLVKFLPYIEDTTEEIKWDQLSKYTVSKLKDFSRNLGLDIPSKYAKQEIIDAMEDWYKEQ